MPLPLAPTLSPRRAGRGRSAARTARSGVWLWCGMEPAHGAGAQALLQAVDQPGQRLRRGARLVDAEPALALGQGLGDEHMHGRRLEAESASSSSPRRSRRRRDQLGDVLGVPARRGEPEIQRQHLPVRLWNSSSRRTRAPTASRARSSASCRSRRVAASSTCSWLRIGSTNMRLRAVDGRRDDRDERLGRAPQRLVEAEQELGLEACGKRRARLVASPRRCAKPSRRMSASVARRQPQRGERQGRSARRFAARGHDPCRSCRDHAARPPRRHRPCRRWPCAGRGRRRAGGRAEIGQQLRLAAEEMRAARDVEEQAVGAAGLVPGRHDGRIAQAPQRQPAQGGGVGGRIGIARTADRAPWSGRWRGARPRASRAAAPPG